MTPPTLQEFAGIFMLALLTAGLIAHPSTGTHAAPAPAQFSTAPYLDVNVIPIDGIESVALPTPQEIAKPAR